MNGHNSSSVSGAGRRAVFLLFTIGALLYVGMQSRVAQSLPSRSAQQLLTSSTDPVKFPPPEERGTAAVCLAAVSVALLLPPRPRPLRAIPRSLHDVGERHAEVHLLRGPPSSL